MFKNVKRCFFIFALAFCIMAMAVSVNAFAASVDSQKGSIHFDYEDIADVEFSLYRVGVTDQKDGYILENAFAGYSIDLTDTNAANTLALYVKKDEIAPLVTGTTDAQGIVKFENLEKGVYLILGGEARTEDTIYRAIPVLLELPQWDDQEKLVWDCQVTGKCTKENIPVKVEVSVVKVWKGDEEDQRPESVTAHILKDGKLVKAEEMANATVKLSAENNWSYTWTGLDSDYTWTVIEEDVPAGYTVSIENNEKAIVLVNTKNPGNPPEKPHTPPHLPQTGQLWWPVMILVCAGLLMLIIGVKVRK